jgi:sterol desaturase/sphingolipid hydroxylase (fatty acid hydroxylase superfamily)
MGRHKHRHRATTKTGILVDMALQSTTEPVRTIPGESSPNAGAARVWSLTDRVVAAAGFPVLISVTVGLTIVAIERGVDPNLMSLAMIVAGYTTLAFAERLIPWHRSWLHSQGDLRTDIGLALTNGFFGGLLTPVMLVAVAAAGAALSQQIGIGLWPTGWPWLAQLCLALVISEFVEYSFHRMMHEVPWMWRFHATHHSAPRLYWLNAARFHPIDLFLVGSLKMLPLALLGAGLPIFALVNLFSAIHGAYQHSNLPVRLGPLNWIFSMTELHRWHHSKKVGEANHNYGGNLILWDIVFGTRFLPGDREPPEDIGIEALPDFPMGFWANLASPFRWLRLVGEAGGAARSDDRARR